jgi:hypothetical protein
VTPEAAALMRHNLALCARQMTTLAEKAKNQSDAATFRRGAQTYRRLLTTLPTSKGNPMNASAVKDRLTTLRDSIAAAIRANDVTLIQTAPVAIDEIIAMINDRAAPMHEDGRPWAPEPGADTSRG